MAIHNEAKKGEIAKTVLMPGDPMRAKYIAENFLEDYRLVNTVRGMYAFTGKYKDKEITVMASGMGMPSIGIYSYELYKLYDVDNIIRIGSCGAHVDYLNVLDIILVENSYTEGNFAKNMTGTECHFIEASPYLNNKIEKTAHQIGQLYIKGNMAKLKKYIHGFLLKDYQQNIKLWAQKWKVLHYFILLKSLEKMQHVYLLFQILCVEQKN